MEVAMIAALIPTWLQGFEKEAEYMPMETEVKTKQERIREGLYKIIIKHDGSLLPQFDWEKDLVKQVMEYLHSQRVAIKADIPDGWILIKPNGKEWQETGYTSCDVKPATKQEVYLVESLIEGK